MIVKAGLASDPVFGKYSSVDDMDSGVLAWIKTRYQATCAGCGQHWWTSPRTLPVCPKCWASMDPEPQQWWWKSKKTPRSLERLLDEWFDGGYEVKPDYNQLQRVE